MYQLRDFLELPGILHGCAFCGVIEIDEDFVNIFELLDLPGDIF